MSLAYPGTLISYFSSKNPEEAELEDTLNQVVSPRAYCAVLRTLKCLSIGTLQNNTFSICSKWKIYYLRCPKILSTLQPNDNGLKYWDT